MDEIKLEPFSIQDEVLLSECQNMAGGIGEHAEAVERAVLQRRRLTELLPEINAALAIMPLVREWHRARKLMLREGYFDEYTEAGDALSAALARVEEGEPCKECEGHKVIVVLGHSRSCPSCNGTGKEKPHA